MKTKKLDLKEIKLPTLDEMIGIDKFPLTESQRHDSIKTDISGNVCSECGKEIKKELIQISQTFATTCAEFTIKRMDKKGELVERNEEGEILRELSDDEKIDMFELFEKMGYIFGSMMVMAEFKKMKIDDLNEEQMKKLYFAIKCIKKGSKKVKKEIQKW